MSELTEALTELATDPAAVVESPEVRPERLEQMRRAFSLHLGGSTYDEIGEALDVSRASVGRLLSEYRTLYRKQLENVPTLHLISERLAKYESIAESAMRDAESATSDRARQSHSTVALKAMRAFDALALDVGVLPKEPDRIYSATIDLKPADLAAGDKAETRTAEQIRADTHELLKHSRAFS